MESPRLAPARRRARLAKTGLGLGGALAFGLLVPLVRAQHAGHHKQPASALDAPLAFRQAVSDDLLAAGILAPAQASPDALTALS